jgi:Glycosyltransferase family 87
MGGIRDLFRSGAWLTPERMWLWALAVLIASLAGIAFLLATADGLNDYKGRPLGTDFSNIYAAGTYVLDGVPAAPFDIVKLKAREQAIFGPVTPLYGWLYPPLFLFVAAAIAAMPYLTALVVWQGLTLLLYLWATRSILGGAIPPPAGDAIRANPLWLLIALAFPAVLINLGHGHDGFLTTALLSGGLILLDRKPILAGVLFGLMAYEPQFSLFIPLVLAASGRWRTLVAAAATVALLVLATTLAFGIEVWRAFFDSMRLTRIVLEHGGHGWHKVPSVFAWVRMWGGPIALAYVIQGAVILAIAIALIRLWRGQAAYPLKAAALSLATVLAAPYSLDYDLVALAPAIAFLACNGIERGFAPYEKSTLALLWLMPLIARPVALHTLIPLAMPMMLAAFALVLHRAIADSGRPTRWHFAAHPVE